ncbi:MAG: hypothetical protein HC896_17490 [Bacteroidales bacterium]|nr:hypothetical protein [Bacteroidales bacterium]
MPAHPSASSFNYTIAAVSLNNNYVLLDATDKFSEPDLLPLWCLNGKGRLIEEGGGDWVTIPNNGYKVHINAQLAIDSALNLTGNSLAHKNHYAAYLARNTIKKYSSQQEYAQSIIDNYGVNINSAKHSNLDSLGKTLIEEVEINDGQYVQKAGKHAYFKPVLFPFITKNPFYQETRLYPVETDYPVTYLYTAKIIVPDNVSNIEIPPSAIISLPENAAKFVYQVRKLGNAFTVTWSLTINKCLFVAEEYAHIKQFYQLIFEKQNEMILLSHE